MSDFCPYFTNDGSVGLYSGDFDDIYHSATGALTESYEKFILPSNINYLIANKNEIRVLDICYGIGYNSKAFLNYLLEISCYQKSNFISKFFKKFFSMHNCYAPIYTYNTSVFLGTYNASIDTNNTKEYLSLIAPIYTDNNRTQNNSKTNRIVHENMTNENITEKRLNRITKLLTNITKRKCNKKVCNPPKHIYIKAVDFDKNLTLVSPFIKTGERHIEKYIKRFPNKKIGKYIINHPKTAKFKIDNAVNFLLLEKIIKKYPEILQNKDLKSLLNEPEFAPYFDKNIRGIFELYCFPATTNLPCNHLSALLHNIYYRHVSSSYKRRLKSYLLSDVDFDIKNDDARKIILDDNTTYNLIFLDAFTPSKCPCLWSYDFFRLLYKHLETDGMLLTYSSSAAVRAAMVESGFFIGENYNKLKNKNFGTIAVKNKDLIKYPLSEYDLGLLKTRAGIFYRDKDLTAQNEAILSAREKEIKQSDRISSTEYKKLNTFAK